MEGLFHVHSDYSSDGRLSLEELREECLKRNLQFMVVTDHAEDFSAGRLQKFIDHCERISDRRFLVVAGLEFNIDREREVHLLVVGLENFVSADGTEEILKKIRENGNSALTVMAHLSRSNHYIPPEYESTIKGIEIWNAAYDSRYLPDHKAIRLFADMRKLNKRLIGFGGLDLHDRSGFRAVRICLTHSCRDSRELLDYLKAGRFIIRGPYVSVSSTPSFGLCKLSLLSFCRRALTVADFIKWKSDGWKNMFLKTFSSRKNVE